MLKESIVQKKNIYFDEASKISGARYHLVAIEYNTLKVKVFQ